MMTGAEIIKQATKYLGQNWKKFCPDYGFNYAVPWCCIWIWWQFWKAGLSKLFYDGKRVCNCRVAFNWCLANLPKIKMADARPGDIVFFTWTGKGNNSFNAGRSIDHIGFIRAKGTSSTAYTIEGNTNGSTPSISKVANRTRSKAYVLGIFRPKYSEGTGLSDVVAYAKKRAKEHHKYKVGGKSWTTGIDCHGFSGACYGHCGFGSVKKKIWKKGSHKKFNTKEFFAKYRVEHNKKGLKKSRLLPGDLVYRKNKSMSGYHSAIYVGDGKVAESVKSGTRIGKLTKKFTYAYRFPESLRNTEKSTEKSTKKKTVKTVEHKATYEVIAKNGSNVRARATKFSSRVGGVAKGKTVKSSKKHGNWIFVPDLKGWICIKSGDNIYLKKK